MAAPLDVIFGPPGTGKTTELTRLANYYATEEGSDSLLLCAYTKTAAQELAGRGMAIDGHQLGTLHALCFHALDRPTIAETQYKAWNDTYKLYPLSPPQSILMTDLGEMPKLRGDQCLATVNILRHRLVPEIRWPAMARTFWALWRAWKHTHGYSDFTDLLEVACTVLPVAPGNPATLIVDEAQDLSLLQWRVLTQWATHVSRFIAAGDDDQCLYRWAGADFTPLLAASSRRVLGQSYRVPQSHQAIAMYQTDRIRRREPKTWQPRPIAGVLRRDAHGWQDGEYWAQQLKRGLEEPWGTYTCLASCSYMLHPLLAAMRAEGIPFSNRWRQARHDWNPLMPPARGIGMVQRLLDFLRPEERLWTWTELATWLPSLIRSEGVLTDGAKAKIALHAEEKEMCSLEALRAIFLPHALDGALRGGLNWLEDHALQSRAATLAYPCRVYRRYGRNALIEEPRIHPGSGHSFKGTESDTVIHFVDLSRSQEVALCEGGDAADDVRRMLYVAVTRSRDTLILAGPQRGYMGQIAQTRPQPILSPMDATASSDDDSEAF